MIVPLVFVFVLSRYHTFTFTIVQYIFPNEKSVALNFVNDLGENLGTVMVMNTHNTKSNNDAITILLKQDHITTRKNGPWIFLDVNNSSEHSKKN